MVCQWLIIHMVFYYYLVIISEQQFCAWFYLVLYPNNSSLHDSILFYIQTTVLCMILSCFISEQEFCAWFYLVLYRGYDSYKPCLHDHAILCIHIHIHAYTTLQPHAHTIHAHIVLTHNIHTHMSNPPNEYIILTHNIHTHISSPLTWPQLAVEATISTCKGILSLWTNVRCNDLSCWESPEVACVLPSS